MKHRNTNLLTCAASCLILSGLVLGEQERERRASGTPRAQHRAEHHRRTPAPGELIEPPSEFRTINGYGNNLGSPELGTPGQTMLRMLPADYADGHSSPAGEGRVSAREISNAVAAQEGEVYNRRGTTDFLWQWGQFLDHDIVETPTIDPPEAFDILVPAGDPWFDPTFSGEATIPLNRSFYEEHDGVREQVNEITAFIDASNVYGSDETRAYALRKLDGSGELKTSDSDHGPLLPYNEGGFANAPSESPNFFLAGDVRANEQAGLTAMHTLFVREHNYWARKFREHNPEATEDEIYEFARMIVGAEMQQITYQEFLPLLLGRGAIRPYRGYDETVDPSMANEFATAAYRLGHSLLSDTLRRVDESGETAEEGDLSLAEAFFDPTIIEAHGIESLLRGLASQKCQELDGQLVDSVRNFLFGPPGSGGFDLASLNIQRGRDHGLPSYNAMRVALGLRPARSFRDVHPDPDVHRRLAEVYDDVDQVDLWVGGLCEPHARGAMVGPLLQRVLSDQFTRLRDGDRFWYQITLPPRFLELVEHQTLSRIIQRNTSIGKELQSNVFLIPRAEKPRRPSTHRPRSNRRSRRRR